METTSNMFKKIKSIFIVEDPSSTPAPPNEGSTQNNGSSAEAPIVSSSDSTEEPIPVDGKPDQKFIELLLKAIESKNIEGFDYLEYKNSLKSITNVIPDESIRYRSAFEMAKTMGMTKQNLIESANHYLGVLKSEKAKFKEALENQKNKQIQGRAEQLKSVEKAIEDKKKLITQLTSEIQSSTAQIDTVREEINDAVTKIEMTNAQFNASYQLVYNQINEDVQKITAHVQ